VKEIRIHGRGGQGNVAAAEMLGLAAFADGKYSQSFPAFGAERTGAPVVAFVRISDRPIRLRSQVYTPDVVIVQDESLLEAVDVLQGLKPGGLLIINSTKKPQDLRLSTDARVVAVPATGIALDVLGRNIPNTTLLGAFCAATGDVSEQALVEAIGERFGTRGREVNARAVKRAMEHVAGSVPVEVHGSGSARVTTSDRPKYYADIMMVAGTSKYTKTGTWRTFRPVFKNEKCTGCLICATLCPEGVIWPVEKKKMGVDYNYCKGCGICAEECPFDDVELVREGAEVAA
jgi:pyruvate ferredoxin oxidoreductase gamma subunit